ncbi:MAG: ABC transporter permease [Prevotellaceae bacterium]|jgi:ABC-2 type transport system permease protein|nr:ABC transporter permease [Prevotellaceae bacterium]
MKNFKFLLQKEFLQIFRNKSMVFMIVMMPTIMLLILPWAATFEQKNIRLSVVDNDRSVFSRKLTEKLSASRYFDLQQYTPSCSEALQMVETDQSDIILILPSDFERNIFRERRADFMLDIDAVNGQKAGVGLSYISLIITDYLQSELPKNPQSAVPQIVAKTQYRYNASMEYFPYMVPGIFAILLTAITAMFSALNIVHEKEIGTIEQINVTPISKVSFIVAKVIPFWVIGLIVLTIGIIIGRLIYGIIPLGNLLHVYFAAIIYIIAISGLGIIISNIASTEQQAMLLIFFTLMLMILLGGLFTPISGMPAWAQKITLVNPFRYIVEVIRLVYLKDSNLHDISPQILKLAVFAVVINSAAAISYRKRNK